jgi:DNA-binding GntR family transcriptional regulator
MSLSNVTALTAPRRLLKPNSLREQIYADLRRRLHQGEFGEDDRLVDIDVAATYGTSRMPVREALLQLANEGYLVGTTRGFALPTLSVEDIRDIFEVRKLLEPPAAANAARDMGDIEQRELTLALMEARQAADRDDLKHVIAASTAFRAAWLTAVHNTRLSGTIARFVDHVWTARVARLRHPAAHRVTVIALETLYDAFMRRDESAARDAMSAYIQAAEDCFFAGRSSSEPEVRAAG